MSKATFSEAAAAATPSSGKVVIYAKTDGLVYSKDDVGTESALSGGIAGSTGATDNRLLRADGTGGATVQSSAITVDDSGNASGVNTLGFVDAALLTIATGAITRTATYHRIDTEAAAASDDLDTISGGTAGQKLIIRAENTARTIVVRHIGGGSGNIRTFDGSNVSLAETYQALELIYDGTNWLVIGSASSGANTTLSNLGTVAANTSLLSDTDNTDDLGSSAVKWANTFTNLLVLEERTAPATPASGDFSLYAKVTGGAQLFMTNDGAIAKQISTSYAILRDEKSTGTNGGGSGTGTWSARDLNTEVSDVDGIVAIASNKFTPIAGDYLIDVRAVAYKVDIHRLRLYNVTGAASVEEGIGVVTDDVDAVANMATLRAKFTANGTDEYRIDHYTSRAQATNGLGVPVSDGSAEAYLDILLTKVA